jgi:oxalate decarboxylase/phosphoglucose isomerase-like protein (cupin superfamily)
VSLIVPPYPPARYTKDGPEVSARCATPGGGGCPAGSRLYDGADWVDGNRNDFPYVPPGGVHGVRNQADEPASILMVFAPGAPREH